MKELLYDIGRTSLLPNFISNVLSHTSFSVKIGSTLSDAFKTRAGLSEREYLCITLKRITMLNVLTILTRPYM